jgi:DNA-directed RNA polymerase specialized sigma24 family protein
MAENQQKAVEMFEAHCRDTYDRIKHRCVELNKEKKEKKEQTEEMLQSIPQDVREALENQDIEKFNQIMEGLPDEEASRIISLCEQCNLVELEELTEEEAAKFKSENIQENVQENVSEPLSPDQVD